MLYEVITIKQRYEEKAEIITTEKFVGSADALEGAISLFKEKSVDIILMVYGAFTGDDVSSQLAEQINVPIILWAPYEPEYKGGRLMSNALVALTMNMASLKRLKHECYGIYGGINDNRS